MERSVPTTRRFTAKQYFEAEIQSLEKHDFLDGQLIAMAGSSETHSLISANVIRELGNMLKGKPCRVYDSNLRVRLRRDVRYSYPDALVVCGEKLFDPDDTNHMTVLNPSLVVEVLSPSTELVDRTEKFRRYIQMESLNEYVLITQNKPYIELFIRQPDRSWALMFYQGLESSLHLQSLEIDLPMSEIFRGVEFPPDPDEQPAGT